jgi:hypothetical protein
MKLAILTSIVSSVRADILWADVCTQVRHACARVSSLSIICFGLFSSLSCLPVVSCRHG